MDNGNFSIVRNFGQILRSNPGNLCLCKTWGSGSITPFFYVDIRSNDRAKKQKLPKDSQWNVHPVHVYVYGMRVKLTQNTSKYMYNHHHPPRITFFKIDPGDSLHYTFTVSFTCHVSHPVSIPDLQPRSRKEGKWKLSKRACEKYVLYVEPFGPQNLETCSFMLLLALKIWVNITT